MLGDDARLRGVCALTAESRTQVNASPAVAEELLPGLVRSLVATAIDPLFPPKEELPPRANFAAAALPKASEGAPHFERLYARREE